MLSISSVDINILGNATHLSRALHVALPKSRSEGALVDSLLPELALLVSYHSSSPGCSSLYLHTGYFVCHRNESFTCRELSAQLAAETWELSLEP